MILFGYILKSASQRKTNKVWGYLGVWGYHGSDEKSVFYLTLNYKFNLEVLESCLDVYIILPEYFALSDFYWLHKKLPILNNDPKLLVFVMDKVADYIPDEINSVYPDSRIINLSKC